MTGLELWRRAPEQGGPPILAIESSCDETAAAVLTGTRELRSSIIHSQVPIHAQYGGVVPELASRSHVVAIEGVVDQALEEAGVALDDIAAVAVTRGPGLVGSLLVGVEYAKGIAMARNCPLIGVNHLEGHLMAAFLGVSEGSAPPEWPFVGLIVSGGHTSLYLGEEPGRWTELGRTLDDAAGEAYDKVSKELGLGYPGGAVIDRLAAEGNPEALAMPRPMLRKPGLDFSFSGLKTWVVYHVRDQGIPEGQALCDLAASFQAAVVDVLVTRTLKAARETDARRIVLSGGVASNRGLRHGMHEAAARRGLAVSVAPPALCTDNAAMIGAAGYAQAWSEIEAGTGFARPRLNAVASWHLDEGDPEAP